MTTATEEEVPFYLMPVAAVLGMYTLVGIGRTVYMLGFQKDETDSNFRRQTSSATTATRSSKTNVIVPLVISWVLTAIGYSFVVAKIERAFQAADYALFDPYEILRIDPGSNTTVVKKAYRELAKIHHPDKANTKDSGKFFLQISKAYSALTDEKAMRNYQLYGHPDGPLSSPTFQMALPKWLLFPEGKIAGVMLLLYLAGIAGLIYFVIQSLSKSATDDATDESSSSALKKNLLLNQNGSVSVEDLTYLANTLKPDSTHIDVLMAVISAPENIAWSLQDLERVEEIKRERSSKSQKEKNAPTDFDDLFNDDAGWDDDDDDEMDEKAALAAKAEAERQAEMERLKQATGKAVVLLEGVDDGVLGQKWVEKTLQRKNVWPPPSLGVLDGKTFEYNGTQVPPLEHPGLRRVLCMTAGRLNSMMLNGHPELLEAGANKRIDQTYFKASMEFRQRVGMYLEAALRVSHLLRSERLFSTIIETIAMFKSGVKREELPMFNGIMTRQYATLPRIKVNAKSIGTPDEDEIATGDKAEIVLDLERSHAEQFLKQKLELFKKQGIPPQVGFQTFREGWWFILRQERVDGKTVGENSIDHDAEILRSITVDPANMAVFENEDPAHQIITAWPMMHNLNQKGGKVKIEFPAPAVPGKYKYTLAIKSQDFLGADQELEFNITVVDAAKVQRIPKEDSEPKKDK